MVTIHVSDSATIETGQEPQAEEFIVQRALISSHSKYFESTFRKGWSGGQFKTLEIDDVGPWVFRVFMGWLFYQEVFYDDQRVEPEPLAGEEQEGGLEQSSGEIISSSYAHLARPNRISCDQQVRTESQAPEGCGADEDAHDPLTWSWTALFELYVFAEKYDTRGLRMQVFNVIQQKLLRARMRQPGSQRRVLPLPREVSYLVDNMPEESKIVTMLSNYYAMWNPSMLQKSLRYYGQFPSSFVALSYLSSIRCLQASRCPTCYKGQIHDNDPGHGPEDRLRVEERDTCEFHEHGENDAERAECRKRWSARVKMMRAEKERDDAVGRP